MDVHEPYHERAPWYVEPVPGRRSVKNERARYLSELRYLDQAWQEFFAAAPCDPATTVTWFLSDHGEEFKDHGHTGHGFSLYQELTGVLNLVHAPGLGVPAQRVEAPVSLADVLPTLLEWAGAEPLEGGDGRSLLPWLRGQADAGLDHDFRQRILFAHRQERGGERELGAAVFSGWKLLHEKDTDQWSLYDLGQDPDETDDLYRPDHPLVQELGPRLERFLATPPVASNPTSVNIKLTPEELARLKELGYIGGD